MVGNKNGITGAKTNRQNGNLKKIYTQKFSLNCKPNNVHDK